MKRDALEADVQRLPTPSLLQRFEAFTRSVKSFQSLHLYTESQIKFDWSFAKLDGFTVFTARNNKLAIYVGRDDNSFFALPRSGALTATYEDGRVVATAGRSLLLSRYTPARLDLSDGLDCVYIKIPTQRLREWIAASGEATLAQAELGAVLSLEDSRVAAFADFLQRLGGELDATGGFGPAQRRRELGAEFRRLFLAGPAAVLAERDEPADPHIRTVRVCVEIFAARLAEKITLAELSLAAGVSERSVQAAFKKRFNHSPWTQLRNLRLERARTMLADPACRLSVADIAVACGFNHFGQFARDFRDYFGETPKRTSFVSRVAGNRWRATLQVAAGSTQSVRRYLERLLAG